MSKEPVAEVRERFSAQTLACKSAGASLADALQGKAPRAWHPLDPGDWEGSLFDLEGIHAAFSREENKDDVVKAVSDAEKPGVSGDIAASCLQGDYLAAMERAFRSRHMTRVRRSMHAAGRRRGHGHAAGLWERGVLGYVTGFIQHSKDK